MFLSDPKYLKKKNVISLQDVWSVASNLHTQDPANRNEGDDKIILHEQP